MKRACDTIVLSGQVLQTPGAVSHTPVALCHQRLEAKQQFESDLNGRKNVSIDPLYVMIQDATTSNPRSAI